MNLYFDTSALVKLFHTESGTDAVTDLIERKDSEIFVSELVKIEFGCALYRRFRNGEIRKKDLSQAIEGFANQMQEFNIEPLGNIVIHEAESLLKNFAPVHGLKTLDALHFATFKLISDKSWYFISTDNALNRIVIAAGLKAINPCIDNLEL